jgi:release factor glutamine methyltransferase
MDLKDAVREGAGRLRDHRCAGSDPWRESELFLTLAAGLAREALIADPETQLTPAQTRRFRSLIARRLRHEPVAYIAGRAPFLGREFTVSRATLIPRPATEMIALELLRLRAGHPLAAFFDIGTGSGCLAVTAAAEAPSWQVGATDISPDALKIARRNARACELQKKIAFRQGDLLTPFLKAAQRANTLVIAANLPYLPAANLRRLPADVRLYEPRTALAGGRDGLVLYYRLLDQIAAIAGPRRHLHLFCELRPEQFRSLAAAARKKIPGLSAGRIVNWSRVTVGVHFSLNCGR